MIVRIVRMTFEKEKVPEFLAIFGEMRSRISSFNGCRQLDLLMDVENDGTYLTYSIWESPEDLEKYRRSDFFGSTWSRTKALFADKPEAWSFEEHRE